MSLFQGSGIAHAYTLAWLTGTLKRNGVIQQIVLLVASGLVTSVDMMLLITFDDVKGLEGLCPFTGVELNHYLLLFCFEGQWGPWQQGVGVQIGTWFSWSFGSVSLLSSAPFLATAGRLLNGKHSGGFNWVISLRTWWRPKLELKERWILNLH